MIQLVPTSPEYADLWQKWRNEPSSLRHNPIVNSGIDNLRERMKAMRSDLSDLKAAEDFQFFVQWENLIVGAVNLRNINHTMRYGEIGYGVGEEFQGKGIGTESIRQFILKIFKETALRRLFAYVAEDNIASRRILEKVGFIQEGICREHFIINGNPTNEVLYGILRSEVEIL